MNKILMDENDLIDLLVERVEFWTQDEEVINLYRQMYEYEYDISCFDGRELDIKKIVDNDYINYCRIIEEGDEDYEEVKKLAMSGERDCYENTIYDHIEAFNDDYSLILVRC